MKDAINYLESLAIAGNLSKEEKAELFKESIKLEIVNSK